VFDFILFWFIFRSISTEFNKCWREDHLIISLLLFIYFSNTK
jgi:hypothetical protein